MKHQLVMKFLWFILCAPCKENRAEGDMIARASALLVCVCGAAGLCGWVGWWEGKAEVAV